MIILYLANLLIEGLPLLAPLYYNFFTLLARIYANFFWIVLISKEVIENPPERELETAEIKSIDKERKRT
ncbi:MAG: hypothetical protein Kow0090_05740 [Myxococcota bacterium]